MKCRIFTKDRDEKHENVNRVSAVKIKAYQYIEFKLIFIYILILSQTLHLNFPPRLNTLATTVIYCI